MVKAAWFRSYAANELPQKFDRVVQSWDTANKASELSDFSVCTSWGTRAKTYICYMRCASSARLSARALCSSRTRPPAPS
jgi:phage terminase large subunit-like protein